MIPRVFHRVWLGGKPMPEPFARWGEGWLRRHPGWAMKTWTETEAAGLENADLLPRCSSLAQRADVVRYEALHREGGVYVDTDMECLRNIEPLIEGAAFFACWQRPGFVSNAIFGGAPRSEPLGSLFRRSRTDFRSHPWNAMGPPFFTPIVLASPDARIFDRRTFIPYTRAEYEKFPRHPMEITDPPPESYAINHRSSVWHADSTRALLDDGGMAEHRRVIDGAQYWHYAFELPWRTTVPTKPGWAERVQKRRGHFFRALLDGYGGTLGGRTVLDLGCCQGYWSFESRRAGASSVLGLDSSEAFIREAEAVRAVLGIDGCSFARAQLEEEDWWTGIGQRQVTLFLGVLYQLADPIHVLRRAMALTAETFVVDGEVAIGEAPCLHLRAREPNEPTTVRSDVSATVRTVPTVSAIVALLQDGGFRSIHLLEPGADLPPDYHARTTASIIARR